MENFLTKLQKILENLHLSYIFVVFCYLSFDCILLLSSKTNLHVWDVSMKADLRTPYTQTDRRQQANSETSN